MKMISRPSSMTSQQRQMYEEIFETHMAEESVRVEVESNVNVRRRMPPEVESNVNVRRRMPPAWGHFTRVVDAEGKITAMCNRCNRVLRLHENRGTSIMQKHMVACYRRTYAAVLLLWLRGVVVKQIKFITTLVAETCTGIAVHFTPIDQIEEQQQRCAAYSQKALPFAITTFLAYVGAPSASSTNTTFKIAMAAFFVAVPIDLISVTRAPKWGSLLTCLSWFLLVLLSYLLLVSFNKDYSYAILPVPIPIVIGLLQHKLRPAAFQRINTDIEAGQDLNTSDEAVEALNNNSTADQDLDDIFNLSAGIVNFGGLISMIMGHLTGPSKIIAVNPAVFFFFFTVALGLYLMMVATVRIAALTLHARHLSYLLMLLLLSTLIATLKVRGSRSDSHV